MPWILLLAVGGYLLWKKLTPESQKELEALAPSAVQDFAPAVMASEPQDLGMGGGSGDGGGDGGGGGGAPGPVPSPSPPSPSPTLPLSAPPAAHAGSPITHARLGLGAGQKRPLTPLPKISTPSAKLGWHR